MTSIYNNYSISTGFNRSQTAGFRGTSGGYVPKSAPIDFGYVSHPLQDNFGTKAEIEAAAKSNPRIREILNEHKLPLKVNLTELEKLRNGHLKNTRIIAAKMYSNLPAELKQNVDLQALQEAAMFHDYGKVLIPEKILNKKGELNEDEWSIMKLHSILGAELLKSKNLSPRALELIKFHHLDKKGQGYPAEHSDYEYGVDSEILLTADKYQALTEERSYKQAMSADEALAIIENDVKNGIISQEVFDALKKSI